PRHTARLVLDSEVNERLRLGGNVVVSSSAFLHGNENNANVAGGTNASGTFIAGSGSIPGYAVVNLHGTYQLTQHVELFARAANILNRQYATAGFLATNAFNPNGSFRVDSGTWTHENAESPAAPRAIWAGVR